MTDGLNLWLFTHHFCAIHKYNGTKCDQSCAALFLFFYPCQRKNMLSSVQNWCWDSWFISCDRACCTNCMDSVESFSITCLPSSAKSLFLKVINGRKQWRWRWWAATRVQKIWMCLIVLHWFASFSGSFIGNSNMVRALMLQEQPQLLHPVLIAMSASYMQVDPIKYPSYAILIDGIAYCQPIILHMRDI